MGTAVQAEEQPKRWGVAKKAGSRQQSSAELEDWERR